MKLRTEQLVLKLALKLAGALLLQHGELSVRHIRAMPFFTNSGQSDTVIACLMRTFDAEIYSKQVASSPIVAEGTPLKDIPGPIRIRKSLAKGDPVAVAERIVRELASERETKAEVAA